jgi:hypothetical protein
MRWTLSPLADLRWLCAHLEFRDSDLAAEAYLLDRDARKK